ncbi:electron transfer flavoprotein subunit alpha/FixB family protein [Desulfococcus sp.]|uniref:electron transfer flavoprotein subunit alpha/FixB family protein n=1 Tax=Desulfococcus sp. TaxID=2025834 RepID=UPI0035932688
MVDIWIFVQHRGDDIEDATYGLAAEAGRMIAQQGEAGRITAVALGPASESVLERLGDYGVDRVLHASGDHMNRYQGEIFSRAFVDLVQQEDPACLLMVQSAETEDLAQRMAAMMKTALVTRAMDFSMTPDGSARAIRPVAGGYLFEDLVMDSRPSPIVLFLPSVLFDTEPDRDATASVIRVPSPAPADDLKTRTVSVIEAAPEDLDLEEADIIVAGGRGLGKGEASFEPIHALARAIGGSVGGTRPVVDWGLLPYERQIGQTGKYVSPRLIINCGISGANEYTAGMEKSQQVIAIDLNPRARMFRFADLGVIGDVHEILPLLISRIEEQK